MFCLEDQVDVGMQNAKAKVPFIPNYLLSLKIYFQYFKYTF